MKISFRDLESARQDPKGFGRKLSEGSGGGPRRRGYFMDWRDAVLGWHSNRTAPDAARSDLEATLAARFTGRGSEKKREVTLRKFDEYVECFSDQGFRPQRTRMDVSADADATSQLEVSGQLPVLASEGTNYIGILLLSAETDWETELRSPLIQASIERSINLLPGEASIGAFDYVNGTFSRRMFTESEISAAKAELDKLLGAVREGIDS